MVWGGCWDVTSTTTTSEILDAIVAAVVMVVFGEVVVGSIGGGYEVGDKKENVSGINLLACPSMEDFAATASKT